ncbi:MAG: insulinase family protein [Firmicutes bacterium]|nr:insulinase family protein [Bacillota bacterium]
MELKIGEKGYGFRIVHMEDIPEASGTLIQMEHEKTGARLIWLKSAEENKLFSVAFKTVPENSTGVFHILEHSVLAGSAKYPVREPFLELMKSSLQTFLNAITFPDKTMYPISSRNEQDFLNLTEVYLDAVFAPAILTNPNIFYQEGWHIELDDNNKPSYKGVVLNEMKGATSNVDEQIAESMQHLLYGDTCYGFNSGGEPTVIPELTYETFCSEYHRYYSGSNAYFFLDGDIPFDKTMTLIEEYLSKQERVENLPKIPVTADPGTPDVETKNFAIGPEDSVDNQAHLALGRIVSRFDEPEKLLAIQILVDVLAGSNEAPLTKAILSKGLAQDVQLYLQDGIYQPYLLLALRNTNEDKMDALKAAVQEELERIKKEGLSKEAMTASINQMEFSVKQPREPQGLLRNIKTLDSWLYGGDPTMWIHIDPIFAKVRKMAETGAMDQLLDDVFVVHEGWKELRMLPSTTLTEEMQKEEEARLLSITSLWSEEDFASCREMNEKLVAWQATPDSEEQLATLPVLDLSEVKAEPSWTKTEVQEKDGIKLLYHPVSTNGVTHINLYFSLGDQKLEDLPALSMLPMLLGNLGTENYPDPLKLQEAVKTYLGSFNISLTGMSVKDHRELCKPYMVVKTSVLDEHIGKAYELIPEILLRTSFADTKAVSNILLQANEGAKQNQVGRGHVYAMLMASAGFSSSDAAAEAAGGYTKDRWLKQLVQNLDENLPEFISDLNGKAKAIFAKARLTASVTATNPVDVSVLLNTFPQGEAVEEAVTYTSSMPDHAAFVIPAQIGYAAAAYHLDELGLKADGSLAVVSSILSLDYLWNMVRVQGGAYGTGLRASRDGRLMSYSFRDPNPAGSLKVYQDLAGALKRFVERGEDFNKYIISTIGEMDPLMMPVQRGAVADTHYLGGITYDDLARMLQQMLETNAEKLLSWVPALEAMARNGHTAVVAHEAALKECEGVEILK